MILPESERRYEGTVCAQWGTEDGPLPGEILKFELDAANVTKPRLGSLVFAACWDGHAYRFGPLEVEGRGDRLYVNLPRSGYEAVLLDGGHAKARIVGCVVRWWWDDEDGARHGVECPQGAPWGPGWRIGSRGEGEGCSLNLLPSDARADP